LSLLGDRYFSFTLRDLLEPMASPYRPIWVTLGIIGFYSGAVVALSFYIRRIIGLKTWRILHYVSFILFFIILFHGIKAGTDSSVTWVQWLYVCSGTIATFLFFWRFFSYQGAEVPRGEYIQIPSTNECLRKIKYLDNLRGQG
jgi:methionine sulfoxide reductase heme-binding subunit